MIRPFFESKFKRERAWGLNEARKASIEEVVSREKQGEEAIGNIFYFTILPRPDLGHGFPYCICFALFYEASNHPPMLDTMV